jgi:hypothetical protein
MAFREPIWKVAKYRDFTGGENFKILPEYIKPNQVVSAQNCIITNEGLLETRLGKTKLNTNSLGTGQITSIHRYSKEGGTRYLIVQHGTALYAVGWDGVTPFASFGTAIKTGLNAAKLRGVVWKDKIYLTNGIDQAFSYDGTVCADVAAIPKCDKLYLYAERFWCVDKATGFLENSNLDDPTLWSDSGSHKVRDGEGDSITALSPQNGGMVIFKENSVQTMYGTNRFNNQIAEPFSRDVGCMSIDSVLDHGLVMGKNNLYTFGLNSIDELPPTHTPLFELLSLTEKTGIFAVADPLDKRALVYVPGIVQKCFCIDAKWGGAITSWSNLNASCFCVASDKGDTGAFLIGDKDNGFIYLYAGANDDGTLIETRIKSAYMEGDAIREKEWSSYIPEIEPLDDETAYRLYYSYDVDYSVFGGMMTGSYYNDKLLKWDQDKWDEGVWGSPFRINEPMFPSSARGHRASFETACYNRIRFNGFTTKFREVGAQL